MELLLGKWPVKHSSSKASVASVKIKSNTNPHFHLLVGPWKPLQHVTRIPRHKCYLCTNSCAWFSRQQVVLYCRQFPLLNQQASWFQLSVYRLHVNCSVNHITQPNIKPLLFSQSQTHLAEKFHGAECYWQLWWGHSMKSFSLTRPKKTASCFMRNRRCHGWSKQRVSLKRWQRVSHSVEAGQECPVDLESGFCQAAPAPSDSTSVACRPGFIPWLGLIPSVVQSCFNR